MKQYVWPGIGLLCILTYYGLVIRNSQNIPFADDLAILATLYDIRTDHSLTSQLAGLLAYHNEHRLLLPRLVAMGLAQLQGGVIDFRWWIWFGNGLLLIIAAVFYRAFVGYRKPFLYFMPVLLLLFQPLWTELAYWGMASVQNIGVLALAASALYLLSADTTTWRQLMAGFGLTCAAVLTGANGLLLFVAVGFVLLLKGQYKPLGVWAVAGVVVTSLYWLGFSAQSNSGDKAMLSASWFDRGLSFLALLGAFVDSQRYGFVCIGVGLIVLSGFAYVGWSKMKAVVNARCAHSFLAHRDLFGLAYSGFLLLTMGAISFHRDYDAVLHVGRYKIYPILLLLCFYLLSLDSFRWTNRMIQVLVVLSVLFNGVAYYRSIAAFRIHRAYLDHQLNRWLLRKEVDAPNAFMRAYYGQRWTNTYREGLYKPPVNK